MSQLRSGSGAGEGSRTLDILLGKYKQIATKLHFVAKESVHIVPQSPYCLNLLVLKLVLKFESPRPQLTQGISFHDETPTATLTNVRTLLGSGVFF